MLCSPARGWEGGDEEEGGTGQGSLPREGVGREEAGLARDTSPSLMQLQTQEGEAGRLPQARSPCHSKAPPPSPSHGGAPGKGSSRKRWGLGAPEPRMVIQLPPGSGYKTSSISDALKVELEYNHIWN